MRRLAIALCLCAAPVFAADETPPALTPVEPPPVPQPVQSGEPLEPEVTIIQSDRGTLQEYRVNGQLYMIKVIPTKGFPYYLVDTDGDGSLETRRNDLDPGFLVPRWVLFSWH